MDKEIENGLIEDGIKLRQLTGKDHGPFTLCCDGSFCSHEWCRIVGCYADWAMGQTIEES